MDNFLNIKDLKTYFYTEDGEVKAVDGVNINIGSGSSVGIVGESGCGKSVTAMSVMRLITPPQGRIINGEIVIEGENILKYTENQMLKIRGNIISMIFQEPMTSLNPVYTIGYQISEALMLHQNMDKREAHKKSIEMLKLVGIPMAEKVVDYHPHKLSGGMRQRAMIAMAMSCNPKLLIADEPTTALDVTIQAQILDLMRNIKKTQNTSIMLITHDLGVVAEMCEYVYVMYGGRVVEEADVYEIFKKPAHPYTSGLLKARPSLSENEKRLYSIPGQVPNPAKLPVGCNFNPRCPYAFDKCKENKPDLKEISKGHKAACFYVEKTINKDREEI